MKRTLLITLGLVAFYVAQAQQPAARKIVYGSNTPNVKSSIANKAVQTTGIRPIAAEFFAPLRAGNPYTSNNIAASLSGKQIGVTTYDLQTNSSIQNRIKYYNNGKISAIWTFGEDSPPDFPDRGEAYQYRAGFNQEWINNPSYLTGSNITRIENIRCGFGSLDQVSGKGDIVMAHNLNGVLQLTTNDNVGDQGSFASSTQTLLDSLFWCRMKVGGPDGKTIHLIALTTPTTGTPAGLPFQGIDGALVYCRSLNGGASWDKVKVLLPGIDATQYKRFSGDGYAIEVKGNTVAFTYGDLNTDWFMMKSTDNGETWTKTLILPFPIPNYDYTTEISDTNNDSVADTIVGSDGSLAIIFDSNDKAHVFSGMGRMLNDEIETPATYSFFPGMNGIMYWRETEPDSIYVIARAPGNAGTDLDTLGNTFANYSTGLASYPSVGIDASNNLYMIFAGVKEADTQGNFIYSDGNNGISYRHIYAIKSTDAGNTWTAPQDLTGDLNIFDPFTEYMYASMAANVADDSIRFIYQEDAIPGTYVTWEGLTAPEYDHPSGDNFINYMAYPIAGITSVKQQTSNFEAVKLFPNPADNTTQLTFTLKQPTSINASIINMLGQNVATVNGGKMGVGNHTVQLNVANLSAGIYFINLQTANEVVTQKLIVK